MASCGMRLSCAAGASWRSLRRLQPAAAEVATPLAAREPRAAPLAKPAPLATAARPGRPAPRATPGRRARPAPRAATGGRRRDRHAGAAGTTGSRGHDGRGRYAPAHRAAAARLAGGGSGRGQRWSRAARRGRGGGGGVAAGGGGGPGRRGRRGGQQRNAAVEFARGALRQRGAEPLARSAQHHGAAAWEYNHGIVLRGIEQVWRHTGDARYLTYIQRYTDQFVSASGTVTISDPHEPQLRQPAAGDLPAAAVPADRDGEVQDRRRFDPRALRHDPAQRRPRLLAQADLSQPDVAGQHLHGRAVPDALRDGGREAAAAFCSDTVFEQTLLHRPARARHVDGPAVSRVGRQRRGRRPRGPTRRRADRRRCGGARSAGTRCRWSI